MNAVTGADLFVMERDFSSVGANEHAFGKEGDVSNRLFGSHCDGFPGIAVGVSLASS